MRFFLLFALLYGSLAARTVVEEHGALAVRGSAIVGSHGKPVSLAGPSFFWSQWQGHFWNEACVGWLVRDWNASVIRAAMGVEAGGYLKNPERERAKVERLVDAALKHGVYVIIDWHDHHATRHAAESVAFFSAMARKYGDRPNVIYEIYNEPLEDSWSKDIKPYAEKVIAAIRAEDPDNLIIVGTPRWSQNVDDAAKDPLQATNIAYALHFYAGTHKASLRAKAQAALDKGLALFVSEWGSCNANGDGAIDHQSTREWFDFIRQHHLSHCVWAVSDKREAASLVVPRAPRKGGWRDEHLTESGRLARSLIREWQVVKKDEEPGTKD